jgi:hypothetical protein
VALSGRQVKACGVTHRADCGVDFGAQATAAAPDRLLAQTPPFAWCPAMLACSTPGTPPKSATPGGGG